MWINLKQKTPPNGKEVIWFDIDGSFHLGKRDGSLMLPTIFNGANPCQHNLSQYLAWMEVDCIIYSARKKDLPKQSTPALWLTYEGKVYSGTRNDTQVLVDTYEDGFSPDLYLPVDSFSGWHTLVAPDAADLADESETDTAAGLDLVSITYIPEVESDPDCNNLPSHYAVDRELYRPLAAIAQDVFASPAGQSMSYISFHGNDLDRRREAFLRDPEKVEYLHDILREINFAQGTMAVINQPNGWHFDRIEITPSPNDLSRVTLLWREKHTDITMLVRFTLDRKGS